jgi:threonine/homoserine/homoserine lactone efflux protein
MLEIFMYAIGVMYTPGPVNLLGMTAGLNRRFRESVGFFCGVGAAMFVLFLFFGYTGERLVREEYLLYISICGVAFILYLAVKVFTAQVNVQTGSAEKKLRFKDGLLLQLLNPKAILVTLPLASIQFPALNLNGGGIVVISLLLSVLAVGAPGSYSFAGEYLSKWVYNRTVLQLLNKAMAMLLVYVAFAMFWEHVYLVWKGVNLY